MGEEGGPGQVEEGGAVGAHDGVVSGEEVVGCVWVVVVLVV